jgi:protocatechuate 3,4-dioxygenase beta subunit
MAVSRRGFIAGFSGLLAARPLLAAGQGLEQFSMAGPPCTDDPRLTPAVPLDSTFRRGAPARTDLREPGVGGERLALSGTVAGLSCGRIRGARVDLWQADARGIYDATGFRLRGHQMTDANGRFAFTTIVPGAAAGRAPHFGVRVQVDGKPDFATELFLPDQSANARDPRFRQELVLRLVQAPGGRSAVFDLVLNL